MAPEEKESRKSLAQYRLENASERLAAAKILLDANSPKDSVGRSYYAMFTAARALLAIDEVDYSRYAGVISYFQKEYVKTGKLDVKFSKYLSQAFQIRNNTDYADFYIVSKKDAQEQYARAEEFVSAIKDYMAGS